MNGWFPKINSLDEIASGNSGIWITKAGVSNPISPVGTSPVWANLVLVYNHNDNTTIVGDAIVPHGYNKYSGSYDQRWAGFDGSVPAVDLYDGSELRSHILNACNPRFGPNQFGYLTPYQSSSRTLIVNGVEITSGTLIDFQLGDLLEDCCWQVPGAILTKNGPINIIPDESPTRVFSFDGTPWLLSNTNLTGGVAFIHPFNSYMGYAIHGAFYYPDCRVVGKLLHVVASNEHGVLIDKYIDFSTPRQDLRLFGKPIGPETPPRNESDQKYNLVSFLLSDPRNQPRSGPTHPQNQVDQDNNLIQFVKFNSPEAYETWAFDENWIYFLEDSQGKYSFSDVRWYPVEMKIGENNAFITGPHEIIYREVSSCDELQRVPINRKMWLLYVYDLFYWGPDLSSRPTIVLVYDNTGGIYASGRMIELNYFASGAGRCRFEAYRSDLVYANGKAVFSDAARTARSDFYLLNSPNVQPQLTNCVEQTCPHLPPLSPPSPPSEYYKRKVFA